MNVDEECGPMLRKYLLGMLSEDELGKVEARILADREFYGQLLEAEEELIDEYLNGELTNQDQSKFEQSFLSTPEGYEQVELARTLSVYAQDAARIRTAETSTNDAKRWRIQTLGLFLQAKIPEARFALLVLLFFFVFVTTWLAIRVLRLQSEVGELRAASGTPQSVITELHQEISKLKDSNEHLAAELKLEQERKAVLEQQIAEARTNEDKVRTGNSNSDNERLALVTAMLFPGGARGAGQRNIVKITPDTKQVRLRLALSGNSYKTYNAIVESADGRIVWKETAIRPRSSSAQFTIQAELLPAADYLIKLIGVADDGQAEDSDTYYFRVLRK
jgi:cell division protein FtsB